MARGGVGGDDSTKESSAAVDSKDNTKISKGGLHRKSPAEIFNLCETFLQSSKAHKVSYEDISQSIQVKIFLFQVQ